MMLFRRFAIVVVLLSCASLILKINAQSSTPSQKSDVKVSSSTTSPAVVLPNHPNTAYQVGEKLEFIIKYEFINAGTATMEVEEGPLISGRPTYSIFSKAESNGFIDTFFKVRDFNGSAVDKASLYSVHFHQNLKEGHYHVIRNTSLDYNTGVYSYEKIYKGKTTQRSGPLLEPVQDILSSFFKTRTLPLELNKEFSITVFSDEDIYPLAVKVGPKVERISVPAGKFDCFRIVPSFKGDAIFKAREGKMTIWVTTDHRRMPVLIRSRVLVGAFDAELTRFTN